MAVHCNTTIKMYGWNCNKAAMSVLMTCDIHVVEQAMFIDSILIKQL